MSRRVAVAIAVAALLTAAGTCAGFGAGAAGAATAGDVLIGPDGGAAPADPATAAALAAAPSPIPSGSSTWLASSDEALAAADVNGADTWVEPSLSPEEAAGAASELATTAVTWCWANAAWHQWGTWPYQQRITDTTYWCALYGKHITYRTSSVTGSGTLCGTSWKASALISGGIGYPWFTMRSSAGFACPTVIPWITIHTNHYEDVNRTDTGGTHEVGSG
jgi:hypothetical protein